VLDACKQTVAAGDAEIKHLTAETTQLRSLQTSHATEVENLKSAHSDELEAIHAQYLSRLETVKQQHAIELEHLKSTDADASEKAWTEFEQKLELIRKDHAAELERIRSEHAVELDRMQNEWQFQLQQAQNDHVTELERLKLAHNDELGRLREDHQLAIEKHTAALAAEHQRMMNEQKAEMESMALNTMSLQDELERVRSEAIAASKLAENTVVSDFEGRLANMKQQFEQDMNELEHRHAAELAERDTTISDAEDVLLAKEAKIDELQEELTELRQRVAENVDPHADKLTAVEANHADEVVRLNQIHVEEVDRLQSELCMKDDKIVELDCIISKGRLIVERQQSDIGDYEKQLEEAATMNRQLQDDNANLQKRLDEKTESLTMENADFKERYEQLQSALETANAQYKTAKDKIADLQQELERSAETASDNEQMLKEHKKQIRHLKEDVEKLDRWSERLENENSELRELHRENEPKVAELESQLAQSRSEWKKQIETLEVGLAESSSACSKLEAERDRFQRDNPSDRELYRQLEKRCQQLQSELKSANAQLKASEDKVADLQQELERARETANSDRQTLQEHKKTIADLEDEKARFDIWGDDIEGKYIGLRELYDVHTEKIESLETQLAQSRDACTRLEAERDQLQRQNPSDSELYCQLQAKTLECVRLKNQLERERDSFEDKLQKYKAENARLVESRWKLQAELREKRNEANETYVPPCPPQPQPAAATACAVQQPSEPPTDYVSRWCIVHYEAEVDRLKRELTKKDRDTEALQKKLDEYKKNLIRIRNERDSYKAELNHETAPVAPLASSQPQQLPAAAAVSAVSDAVNENDRQ